MNNQTTIHNDQVSKPKGILDMTPWEISQIDAFQNRNRGFIDEADEELENDFMNWED